MNKNKTVYDYVLITGLNEEIIKLKQENEKIRRELDDLKKEFYNYTKQHFTSDRDTLYA